MRSNKVWIAGNVLIGAGAVISLLYILFGLFWENPHLGPWYIVVVLLIFLVFNYFYIPQRKFTYWLFSLFIMLGSLIVAYSIHALLVLQVF